MTSQHDDHAQNRPCLPRRRLRGLGDPARCPHRSGSSRGAGPYLAAGLADGRRAAPTPGCTRWGRWRALECAGAARGRPGLASLNGLTGRDLAVTRCRRGCRRLRRPPRRPLAHLLLPGPRRPVPSPFERGLALWWPHRLDPEALHDCAAALPGAHDFTAFTPTDSAHVHFERDILRAEWRDQPTDFRILSCGWPVSRSPGCSQLWIEADAFMRSMVRVLVGTMLEVAGSACSAVAVEDAPGKLSLRWPRAAPPRPERAWGRPSRLPPATSCGWHGDRPAIVQFAEGLRCRRHESPRS